MHTHRALGLLTATALTLTAACGTGTPPPADGSRVQTPTRSSAPLAPVGQWLSGDLHVHSDHSADGSGPRQALDGRGPGNVSVSDQITQGALKGLQWMPITDHRTYDQHYDPLWESADLLLIPGEEANGSPHANPIGAVEMIVQGALRPRRPGWSVLQTSIWDAHAQGAIWSHNHPDDGFYNGDGTLNDRANAVGADMVELWNKASNINRELEFAENRWNAGFRFGSAGASDNHFRELWAIAGPGQPETQVFASDYTERGILQALDAGRSTITHRNDLLTPQLLLDADMQKDGIFEAIAGDEIVAAPGTAGTLRVRVRGGLGTTVSIYRNPGRAEGAVAEFMPTLPEQTFTLAIEAQDTHSWYYAEARGPGEIAGLDTTALDQPQTLVSPSTGVNERRALSSAIFIGPTLATPQPEQALPTDIGSDDGARAVIGPLGEFSGFADVAVSGALTHVVAERHGPGETRVIYRRVSGSTLGAETDLAPLSRSARFPRIAAQGDDIWVAWQDERAGQVPRRPAIYLRHSNDGGLSWQPEQLVRGIPGRAERPDLALMPEGAPVVVWQEIRAANPFDVFAQIIGVDAAPQNLSRAGKTVTAGNPLDTRSAIYPASVWPAVAVREDGLVAVAFHDNRTDPDPLWTGQTLTGDSADTDNWQIRVSTRPAQGAWSPLRELGSNDRAERHADVGFTDDGELLVLWTDRPSLAPANINPGLRYALSSDDGASFGESAVLAEDANAMSQYPRLGNDSDGRLRAVWYDNRSEDWRWRVMTAVFGEGQWRNLAMIPGRGINTWPATHGGAIVFASTRDAQRVQRDRTQRIYLLGPTPAP